MKRPVHLPDFTDPPLDEVVLGVQFAPIPSYSSVFARDVWGLFKKEFPKVQEQLLLDPQFETFGGANIQPDFRFQVSAPPIGSRLWFVSKEENHLVQFQSDRFLTNWRKRPNPQPYPRFEGIAHTFEKNLRTLSEYVEAHFDHSLDINQAEVAYINLIPVDDFSHAGDWFSLWNGGNLNVEGLNTNFNEVVLDGEGRPYARLFHSIQSVFSVDGRYRAFNLSLTFRGKPAGNDIESAMKFLVAGREAIVLRFKEVTAEKAHKVWGILG